MKKVMCVVAFVLLMVCSNRVEAADKYEVKLSWDSKVYDGNVHCPKVRSVTVNGEEVDDYTVLYPYHCEDCGELEYHKEDTYEHYCSYYKRSFTYDKGVVVAGNYKIKVVVNNKEISKTFKIKKRNIKGMFRLSATKWIYTGKTIKPDFVWKAKSKKLWYQIMNCPVTKNDYPPFKIMGMGDDVKCTSENLHNLRKICGYRAEDLTYFAKVTYPKKSKKCGKYKIVLKGKGNYTGTVTFKYSIVKWKTVEKYRGKTTKHLKSKEAFEKAVKKFCSYSCFRDGAYWDLFTHGGCDGFASYLEEFLGYVQYDEYYTNVKKVRVGDKMGTKGHICWVIGIDGNKVWTIGGNECKHVSVDYTPKSTLKDIFECGYHNIKK